MTSEADHNRTAQRQDFTSPTKREIAVLSLLLFGAVASFFAGWLLSEDSTGWARFDFYTYHWPTIENFSASAWSVATRDYSSATNPLFYMIVSVLPLHDDQNTYRTVSSATAFAVWPVLAWAYYCRYQKFGVGLLWALFGASTILISPSFRSAAFWGITDWLPFVFCACTSLLLSGFQDSETNKTGAISPLTLIALAVVSACAFYARQFYAFVPVCAAWVVLTRTKTPLFLVLSVFFVTALPEVFLVYLWKGLYPPSNHGASFHFSLINVWEMGAMIGLFSLPVIVGCIRRALGGLLPQWWRARSTIVAIAGLPLFILALRASEWPSGGGGIVVKAGLRMGALGSPFILSASYLGLATTILFSMRSATNAVLAGTFFAPLLVVTPMDQKYVEPTLIVALFLFADTQTSKTVFNKRVLSLNFAFSACLLTIAIAYYSFRLWKGYIPPSVGAI